MKEKIYAVITGDIIDSTTIMKDYHSVLLMITEDIRKHILPDFIFDIFRGDSFQGLVNYPAKALLIGILIRAGIRRNTRGNSLEDIWDARISIGIGLINAKEISPDVKLGRLDGDAFVRSGRSLETMKNQNARLKIVTGDKKLDSEFEAICPLIDTIVSRWTTAQAEAVYLSLLSKKTQKEIGAILNITQKGISKRLETSNLNSMNPTFEHFEEILRWKYSK